MGERLSRSIQSATNRGIIDGAFPSLLTQGYWDERRAVEGLHPAAASIAHVADDYILRAFPRAVTAIDFGDGRVIQRSEAASAGVRPEDRLTWTLAEVEGYRQVLAGECEIRWEPLPPFGDA